MSMLGRRSFVIVCLAAAASMAAQSAVAQPAVTASSGQWTHGSAVTINGSAFGSKGTAAPAIWDDASGTNIANLWSGTWPSCANNSAYNLDYRTPTQVGRNIPLPHSHITKYIAGAHNPAAGANCGYNVIMFKTRTVTLPAYTYATWYERVDDRWTFGGDDNFKTFAYSVGTGPYEMPNNWYLEYNPRPTSTTSGASWHINDDGTTLQTPDQSGHSWWWDSAINPMSGVWKKIEVELKYTSANDGYIRLWENGVLKINYLGRTDALSGSTRTEGIGGYARNYGFTSNWRYFADVYFDYSRARVVLGNASTLSASTIREVQIPTTWSASSISLTVNLGKFSDGQTAYVYVFDPNGVASTQGFPVTLGSGGADTLPPTVMGVAPINGSTGVATNTAVSVTFSEAMMTSTITAGTILVKDPSNVTVTGTVAYNSTTHVATWTPSVALANSQTYGVTVKSGSSGVKDAAGNALAADFTSSFTTVAAAPPPPPGGLVAALGFDEGTGTTTADASGNRNTGTIAGATWVPGRFGSALSFNGTGDWVTVADSAVLDFTSAMTIEAWVNPTALSGWRTALMKETTTGLAWALYANDNSPWPAGYVRIAGAANSSGAGGATQLPLNTWTHLAATYDGTALKLFVNGVEVSSQPTTGAITASTGPLHIGGNTVWSEYFAGLIDEVRVYSRALTATEIQTDMNTAINPTGDKTPPTVTGVTPAAGAKVALSTSVTATFSEAVQASTVNTTTVTLRDSANVLVTATVTYNATSRTLTLLPSALLRSGTAYTATIKGGSTGVKDLAGNALATDYTWTFSTASPPAAPKNLRIIK